MNNMSMKQASKPSEGSKPFDSTEKMVSYDVTGPFTSLLESRRANELAPDNVVTGSGNSELPIIHGEIVFMRNAASSRGSRIRNNQNRFSGEYTYRKQAATKSRNFRRSTIWF